MDALYALIDCVLGFFPCYFLFGCKKLEPFPFYYTVYVWLLHHPLQGTHDYSAVFDAYKQSLTTHVHMRCTKLSVCTGAAGYNWYSHLQHGQPAVSVSTQHATQQADELSGRPQALKAHEQRLHVSRIGRPGHDGCLLVILPFLKRPQTRCERVQENASRPNIRLRPIIPLTPIPTPAHNTHQSTALHIDLDVPLQDNGTPSTSVPGTMSFNGSISLI